MRNSGPDAFKYWQAVGEKIFGYYDKLIHKEERSEDEESLIKLIVNEMTQEKKMDEATDITPIVKPLTDEEIKEINKNPIEDRSKGESLNANKS